MKYILLFIFSFLLISCSDKQQLRWVCTCQQQKDVAAFVTTNIKSANNMSDEEMEDVVSELKKTGIQTNCHQKLFWVGENSEINWSKSKLDSGEIVMGLFY